MATCKDCEHYKKNTGDKNSHNAYIMYCDAMNVSGKEKIGYRKVTTFAFCSQFTPKKPKEPEKEVERKHPNCRYGERDADTEPCKTCMAGPINEHGIHVSLWQPIEPPKPAEKPKTYGITQEGYDAHLRNLAQHFQEDQKQSIKKKEQKMVTCEECREYCKYEGDKISENTGKKMVMYCSVHENHYSDIGVCPNFKSREKYERRLQKKALKQLTKSKEQKMKVGIFKFSTRRYVMACTLIVTTKIAILLNPLVFQLLKFAGIKQYNDTTPLDNTSPVQILAAWAVVVLVVVVIYAALWAYNRATAWLFGEKK